MTELIDTKTDVLLQAKNVCKSYNDNQVQVIKNISLTLNKGEFVALMGPSGCGKSTLLNILGGIDSPDSGSLLFQENDLTHLSETQRTEHRRYDIGFIFQFFNLLNTLTVEENVALPLNFQTSTTTTKKDALIHAMLERVGLSHRVGFYPSQLSGGEMQRVAIARALIHNPKLLIADEPTGNLDSETGKTILALLRDESKRQNQSIVMATHSDEAATYADRVLRIKDGVITNI